MGLALVYREQQVVFDHLSNRAICIILDKEQLMTPIKLKRNAILLALLVSVCCLHGFGSDGARAQSRVPAFAKSRLTWLSGRARVRATLV